jgi:Fe-S-cluster containining protein
MGKLCKMTYDKNYCKRCGNCCKGMIWRKRFDIKEVFHIVKQPHTKKNIEESLVEYYKLYLWKKGLPVEKVLPIEWSKDKIIVQVRAGRCKYLAFTTDNKAICLNYKNRPNECRNYLCKKVKEKVMMEKVKESERAAKSVKSIYWENKIRPTQETIS